MQRRTGDRVLGWSWCRKFNFSLSSHTSFTGQNLYFLGLCLSITKGNQITQILQYLFWQSSSSESPSGCRNIPTATTVISPPTTLWHSTVSLKILDDEIKLLKSSQETVLLNSLLDQGQRLGSQGRIFPIYVWASGFPTKTMYLSYPSSTSATYPTHHILLHFIKRTILD